MMFRSYSNTSKHFLRDYVTIAMVIIRNNTQTAVISMTKNRMLENKII